jgi:hypothetical protein
MGGKSLEIVGKMWGKMARTISFRFVISGRQIIMPRRDHDAKVRRKRLNVYRFKDRSTMLGESPRAGYSFLLLHV